MRKLMFLIIAVLMVSCGGNNTKTPLNRNAAERYIRTITGFTCEKAAITDNDFLVIAIDAVSNEKYDFLASQFLDEAKSEGVTGLKGVLIVDIKFCEFQQGAVVGKRIGRAYSK